jgi:type IX secretion system PorP/SprF family membrane protein
MLMMLRSSIINAQTDFPVSMATSSPIQLNPAETGVFDDKFRVHAYFKTQVSRAISGGIKGTGLTTDYNLQDYNMGFGLSVFSNSVNRTALRDFNMLLAYSYRLYLNDWSMFSFGVQGGFKQVGFSLAELSFGSQFDPTYKGGFNPNNPPSYLPSDNKTNLDASVGTIWKAFLGPAILLKTSAAAYHLIPVRTDFLNEDTYLQPKYVFSTEVRYGGDPLHWIPSVMYVTQSGKSYTEAGLMLQFRDRTNFANIGFYYRTPNVMIPTIGIGTDQFMLNLNVEYYHRNSFSQIFNISLTYFPKF